jgi:hypothetical protein
MRHNQLQVSRNNVEEHRVNSATILAAVSESTHFAEAGNYGSALSLLRAAAQTGESTPLNGTDEHH